MVKVLAFTRGRQKQVPGGVHRAHPAPFSQALPGLGSNHQFEARASREVLGRGALLPAHDGDTVAVPGRGQDVFIVACVIPDAHREHVARILQDGELRRVGGLDLRLGVGGGNGHNKGRTGVVGQEEHASPHWK